MTKMNSGYAVAARKPLVAKFPQTVLHKFEIQNSMWINQTSLEIEGAHAAKACAKLSSLCILFSRRRRSYNLVSARLT